MNDKNKKLLISYQLKESKKAYQKGIFGDWKVTKSGDVKNTKNGYIILKERLTEPFWLIHVTDKQWCNANDFIDAYMCALDRIGITELTITVK